MPDHIPARVWLLIAIAIAAYAPASYVFRHITYKPAGAGFGRLAERPDWRAPGLLRRNLAIIAALVILAIFIFTPIAEQFAHSPHFMPILVSAGGLFSLFTVLKGTRTGRVQPFVRGFSRTYNQEAEPKRYWASMAWNTTLGFFMLWVAMGANRQAEVQPLEDRCFDTKTTTYPPQEKLSACNQLIARRDRNGADLGGVFEARGTAYYRLSNYPRAMADYTGAIRLDPRESSSRYNRGLVNEQLGRPGAAIFDYTAAIALQSDNADAYLNRALILFSHNKLDASITDLTQVIALRPKDAIALSNRGLAYAWKDDPDRAERDFAVARTIDPSNAVLLHGEALLADDSGEPDIALARLDEALRRDPADLWSLSLRAKVYRQLHRFKEAQANGDAIKQLSPAAGLIMPDR